MKELICDQIKNSVIMADMEDIYNRNVDYTRLKNKTIMITGAYGMIASEIIYFLIYLNEFKKYNMQIIAFVRKREKFEINFKGYSNKDYIHVYTNSIYEKIELPYHIDYIIHAAGIANPRMYSTNPVDVLMPNIMGTYQLLELCASQKVESFLLFSSGDIYGKIENICKISEDTIGYTDTMDIHSCYGESKRMAETMCKAFYVQKNVNAKVARIFHTYGPRMDVKNDPRVFSSFIADVLNNRDVEIKGSGLEKRSFCYITDAISSYFKIMLDGENGQAYNVCNSSQYITIKELAEIIASLRKNINIKYQKRDAKDTYIESRVSGDCIPDNNKVKMLGAEFKVDCKEGFKNVLNYLYT